MKQHQPMPPGTWNDVLLWGIALSVALTMGGCVWSETHQKTLDELGQLRKESGRQLTAEQDQNRALRDDLTAMREKARQLEEAAEDVRRDRDQLKTKADDLQRKLDTTRQELDMNKDLLNSSMIRMGTLGKEHEELKGALGQAQGDIRDLKTQLEVEKAQVSALREDKQHLLGGTATAQSEIARLQKKAGELETEAARARELERQLGERNQEIGTLRQSVADRDAISSALARQEQELAQAKERIEQLTAELAAMSENLARVNQERDGLAAKVAALDETAALLAQEKAAKEEEIKRLTGTYQDLETSLRSEIARGDIKIKQVRDRLTINVVDRILFDSGSAKIKPEGLKVLKTVGTVLKGVTDKHIRIDGHTDNVPISARLQDRFKTNWELSTARATSVVRYLIDEAAITPILLTAAGHADTQPVAENDSEDGRMHNRRIEIALYPKDLGGIAESIEPQR